MPRPVYDNVISAKSWTSDGNCWRKGRNFLLKIPFYQDVFMSHTMSSTAWLTAIHNKKNIKIKERGKNLKLTDNLLSDQESNQLRLPVIALVAGFLKFQLKAQEMTAYLVNMTSHNYVSRLKQFVINFVLTGSSGFCCIKTAKCVKWSHEQVVCVAFHRIIAQPSSIHLPLLLSLSRCEYIFKCSFHLLYTF